MRFLIKHLSKTEINSQNKKTLAVLGCGVCGSLSAKGAIENCFKVTIFEKLNEIGGIWSGNGHVSPQMSTNIRKNNLNFSDFKWRDADPLYPSKERVHLFLKEYCKTFGL